MNARRITLIAGLVLALGTGLLFFNYLAQVRNVNEVAQTRVVVASRDIPARVQITADMLSVENRVTSQTDTDVFKDPKEAAGQLALISIPAGSPVTHSKVAPASAFALPMKLTGGLRAVSISIDRVKGVSGLLQPGDRVDVIAVPPRVGNETPKATTILRGALVLAIGNSTEQPSATPPPENQASTTVTLAVTPQQANLLALADVDTTLRLALRSASEPLRAFPVEPLELGISTVPAAAPVIVQQAPAAAPAPRAPAERTEPRSAVTVIEGDRFVDVTNGRP